MSSRVTMRDVAEKVGMSPMTVSRALRDDDAVNAKTRDLIRRTARELGYVYDTTAQAFRTNRSGFVAFTLPSLDNANFATTYRELSAGLSDTTIQLLLGSTNYRVESEEALVRQLLTRSPEAIILTGGHHTIETRKLLAQRNIPVIEVWDLPADPLGHAVGFSNADAMAVMVEHLAQSGRQKLAFVGATAGADQRGYDRRLGAMREAARLGLPEVGFIDCGVAPVSMSAGEKAIKDLGPQLLNYDALICVSDPVAFGCLCACRRMGVRVPDDIALTGFGAFEVAGVSVPRITTVDVNAGAIGECVADLLKRVLRTDRSLANERHDVGFHLVPGETS